MKVYLWIIFILIFTVRTYSRLQEADREPILSKIRTEFYQAIEDKKSADRLHKFIKNKFSEKYESYPPNILAYMGALEAIKAKHAFNPYNKVRHVVAGLKKLDNAVALSTGSLEVRFLRFAVLHNIPAIFGYRKELKDDMTSVYNSLISEDYTQVDRELQKGVAAFLIESGRLEDRQSQNLRTIFSIE